METTYEVYTRKKGESRWSLDAQYGDGDKDRAVHDAKRIAAQVYIEAVQVVREDYHPESNVTKNLVVYTTEQKSKPKGPASQSDRMAPPDHAGAFGHDGDDDDDDEDGGRRRDRAGLAGRLFRRKAARDAPPPEVGSAAPKAAAAAKVGGGTTAVFFKLTLVFIVSLLFAAVATFSYVAIFFLRGHLPLPTWPSSSARHSPWPPLGESPARPASRVQSSPTPYDHGAWQPRPKILSLGGIPW